MMIAKHPSLPKRALCSRWSSHLLIAIKDLHTNFGQLVLASP